MVLCRRGRTWLLPWYARDRPPGTGWRRPSHARLLLTGGSAFGLAAVDGVVRFLEEKGVGLDMGVARIPLVSAAVLFDVVVGDPSVRPDAAMGYEAASLATSGDFAQGSVGAGTGATVGKVLGLERAMKGGLGSASAHLAGGLIVGAIAAVNAFGEIRDPQTRKVLAGPRLDDGTLGDTVELLPRPLPACAGERTPRSGSWPPTRASPSRR